jgi:hypothetical protein
MARGVTEHTLPPCILAALNRWDSVWDIANLLTLDTIRTIIERCLHNSGSMPVSCCLLTCTTPFPRLFHAVVLYRRTIRRSNVEVVLSLGTRLAINCCAPTTGRCLAAACSKKLRAARLMRLTSPTRGGKRHRDEAGFLSGVSGHELDVDRLVLEGGSTSPARQLQGMSLAKSGVIAWFGSIVSPPRY